MEYSGWTGLDLKLTVKAHRGWEVQILRTDLQLCDMNNINENISFWRRMPGMSNSINFKTKIAGVEAILEYQEN